MHLRRSAAVLTLVIAAVACGQGEVEPLRLTAVNVGGARNYLSDGWATLSFQVENRGDAPRAARVVALYPGRPDVQYGRDLWLPGRSLASGWLPLGPPPAGPAAEKSRDVQFILVDRTGGGDRTVPVAGTDKLRVRTLPYRKRESSLGVILDADAPVEDDVRFLRTFRSVAGLSMNVQVVPPGHLAGDEPFDGLDTVVVAGRRLADDPAAELALLRWVQAGGRLWVWLDRADPDLAARLMGGGFEVVGRTSLTEVEMVRRAGGDVERAGPFEEPVAFVRVAPGPDDTVPHTVDGWLASFARPVGRGRAVATTVGRAAWVRSRAKADPKSPYPLVPDLPVPLMPLAAVGLELKAPESTGLRAADLEPLAADEIGYSIIGRGTASAVFGGFLLAVLAAGIGLRWTRRPELAGWLAPAAALGAGATFVVLGESSRHAVPPTAAAVQLVDVAPDSAELPVSGHLALYRPDAGPAEVASVGGGRLELDAAGLDGQTRRLIQTDLAAWHWENLALPAGVRAGLFHFTARTDAAPAAIARFGPGGLEGRLTPGPLRNLSDALVHTASGRAIALRLGPDGTFSAGDDLPPGQYLPGAVLSDAQQRRQAIYRRRLTEPTGRDTLLAWADPLPLPFTFGPGVRTAGSALATIPLAFERAAPGSPVTVPCGFVSVARMQAGKATRPTLTGQVGGVTMELRFQIPESAWPMAIERATLHAKLDAPGRRFAVSSGGAELLGVDSPSGAYRVAIDAARPDVDGGLTLTVTVGDAPGRGKLPWSIAALELEVTGRVSE